MSRKSTETVPPRRSRVNGWSQPIHCFQVVVWIVFLILTFTTFGIFIPFLPPEWRYIAYSVTGGIWLFYILAHLVVVSIDPAEASVRLKSYSRSVPTFDRSKHAHVIERQYCYLCKVTVNVKSKHCIACNKCVSGFDHHCKWLNNCVGSRNYWYFFASVASASAGLLCVVAMLLYVFTQYFINPARLRTDPHYGSVSDQNTWLLLLPLLPVRTGTPVFLGIVVLVLPLELISLLLVGQLLLFHLYLRAKKLSTYDYLKRDKEEQSSEPPAVQRGVTPKGKELSQLLIKINTHSSKATMKKMKIKATDTNEYLQIIDLYPENV
ncbi:palmitoyltransferase ZDHHC11-like [Mesoplodon densirostris]|uniref:palmitoyltransferase ZDHHC11-like n=1 Tax=Mesoplodon densirostris TaxID=48708 RepID=UPI0028DB858C|nr:palmitoyltransferase ZDHHC11-like [Mesoplodon densirostris]